MRKNWALGFFGLLGIRGLRWFLDGDFSEAVWLAWFIWFIYFIPQKKK